ncbi:flagellin [Lachnospiraceae bacterium G11]|nr:flagellin [Lachnospiraceae bacterium G11]
MRINYNVSAMIANNSLQRNDNNLAASLERLSSGLKINHGKDNPAGLAMGKRMNAQLKGLSVATQNASNGISIIETADGAMAEMQDILQRVNELCVKANNGTLSDDDRKIINDEVVELKDELTRIKNTTEFNSMPILNGEFQYRGYTNNKEVKVSNYSAKMNTAEEYKVASIKLTGWDDDKLSVSYSPDSTDTKLANSKASADDGLVTITTQEGYEIELELDKYEPYKIDSVELTRDADDNITGATFTSTDSRLQGASENYDSANKKLTITAADGTIINVDLSGVGEKITSVKNPKTTGTFGTNVYNYTNMNIDLTGIGSMRLQVGANEGQVLEIPIPDVSLRHMGIRDIDVSTKEGAQDALERIGGAISYISQVRSELGALQNRLESNVDSLDITYENMTSSYSRIMDVDMAEEMSEYTKNQILTQAGTSMLAQANERPSQVLQLLQ